MIKKTYEAPWIESIDVREPSADAHYTINSNSSLPNGEDEDEIDLLFNCQ